jgi:hypothetical protein
MPTHQSLSGASDDELLQRMVKTHPERFGEGYWKFFRRARGAASPVVPDDDRSGMWARALLA